MSALGRRDLGPGIAGFCAYVVSATGEATRNADLLPDLRAAGLADVRAGGVDLRGCSPTDLAGRVDQRLARRVYGRSLTPAEVGCALSHRGAWQSIVESGSPWGLVLEDDAVVDHRLPDALRTIGTLDPSAPWLVALHSTSWPGHPLVLAGPVDASGLYRLRFTWSGACAYAVSAAAARVLLAGPEQVGMVADWPPEAARCRLAAFLPHPVTTGSAASLIEPERSAAGSSLRGRSARDRYERYVRGYLAARPRIGGYRAYVRWWNGAGVGLNRTADRVAGSRWPGLVRVDIGGTPVVRRGW